MDLHRGGTDEEDALPVLVLAVACGDGGPFQPEGQPTVTRPEAMAPVAATSGAVKMVPFRGRNAVWGSGDSGLGCEGHDDYLWWNAPSVMNVTHMGRSDYDTLNCWAFDDQSPIGLRLISQTGWVEAANGGRIFWYGAAPQAVTNFDLVAFTYTLGPLGTGWHGQVRGCDGLADALGHLRSGPVVRHRKLGRDDLVRRVDQREVEGPPGTGAGWPGHRVGAASAGRFLAAAVTPGAGRPVLRLERVTALAGGAAALYPGRSTRGPPFVHPSS